MSTALMIGAVLAVACLAYVLYPLTRPAGTRSPRRAASVTDEEVEAAISVYRTGRAVGVTCTVCGPRPEPDAIFCSDCGRRLSA